MFDESLEAEPSTPSPMATPAASSSLVGQTPMPNAMSEAAQWQTLTPALPRRSISPALKWIPCATQARGVEPSGLLEEIDRAHAERLDAIDVLVERLAEMGVQPAIVALGEFRRSHHHPLRHRERRAGRKRDADHRAGLGVVIAAQHPLAVLEDRLRILHDRVGLQAAVLLGNAHRSARDRHAQAELRRLFDLDVDRVREVRGKEIVMIGRGRAAGQHQFDQRHPDRDAQGLGRHAIPHPLHRNQPGNELLAEACGMGARQRLVEVMMRVDKPRQHDMARGVERRIGRNRGRLAARDAFDDLAALDHDSALGIGCEDGERVLDP